METVHVLPKFPKPLHLHKSYFTRYLQYFRDGGPSYMMDDGEQTPPLHAKMPRMDPKTTNLSLASGSPEFLLFSHLAKLRLPVITTSRLEHTRTYTHCFSTHAGNKRVRSPELYMLRLRFVNLIYRQLEHLGYTGEPERIHHPTRPQRSLQPSWLHITTQGERHTNTCDSCMLTVTPPE